MSGKRNLDRDSLFKSILGDLGAGDAASEGNLVDIASIRFNSEQPRRHFDEASLAELSNSIRQRGVLEPVLVRRSGDGFELIAGERRTRAASLAGLQQVPAIVLDVDDDVALEISIMENLQREDLNAVEETEAVLRFLQLQLGFSREQVTGVLQEIYNQERGRSVDAEYTDEVKEELRELMARLGRFTPASFHVNRVPILQFPQELQDAVRSGQLEFTKAQALARVKDAKRRRQLLAEAVGEGLTLSQIRARVKAGASGGAAGVKVDDPLLASTRRLLSARRLASLSARERSRVEKLLKELNDLLSD